MAGIIQKKLIESSALTAWQKRHNLLLGYENGIRKDLATIQESFIWIGIKLCEIENQRLYDTVCNYHGEYCKDIFEYALQELDCRRSTVYNLMAVARTFAKPYCGLLPEYKEYSYSQLVELLSFTEEERKFADPHLSVRRLQALKRGESTWWTDETGRVHDCKLPTRQKEIETEMLSPLEELAAEEPKTEETVIRPDVWTEKEKFDKEYDDCIKSIDKLIDGTAKKEIAEQIKAECEEFVFHDFLDFARWHWKHGKDGIVSIRILVKKQ